MVFMRRATDKKEPQWGASAESVSAQEAAQILAPEAAGAPAAQAPFVMPEPRQEPDPSPAAAGESEDAEVLKPALKPVPREQVRAQAERERAADVRLVVRSRMRSCLPADALSTAWWERLFF